VSKISVSVVIPAYNRAKTIAYCLDSVCNQTVPADEVIVVDDHSTDATVDIVNNYRRTHPSVRCVVLERNSGAQAARNRGIAEATGEWIAFQDSDDEWVHDKLEKQIDALEKVRFDPMTVVHTDCFRFDHLTSEKSVWALPRIDGEDVFPSLLRSAGPMFQGMLTSKIALEKIGFLDEAVPSYQEWDTSIQLAKQCRFIHLREPLFVYHLHPADTISKNRERDMDGYQYVVDKYRQEMLDLCGADALNGLLENNALRAMRWGLYEDAGQILAKSIGSSARSKLLRFLARHKINPRWYDLSARVVVKINKMRSYVPNKPIGGIR
jgi:glycosyltransferase involved in cell wall biosynthesis